MESEGNDTIQNEKYQEIPEDKRNLLLQFMVSMLIINLYEVDFTLLTLLQFIKDNFTVILIGQMSMENNGSRSRGKTHQKDIEYQ